MADSATHSPPDRCSFRVWDTVKYIWLGLGLPESTLQSLDLEPESPWDYPSSFRIGHLARASIALNALAAAFVDAQRNAKTTSWSIDDCNHPVRRVSVSSRHALAEFVSIRLYRLNEKRIQHKTPPLSGLFQTADDRHVRMHSEFPHHRDAALNFLGHPSFEKLCEQLGSEDLQPTVQSACAKRTADALEGEAQARKAIIHKLRSAAEWDDMPQGLAIPDFPITLRRLDDEHDTHTPHSTRKPQLPPHMPPQADRCLRGVRVIELTRVIAGPTAGRALAAHGADVLWVTSPKLPALPALDCDMARGKRTIQLDLTQDEGREKLAELVRGADVFLQGYRPGALKAYGFGAAEVAILRPGIVYGSVCAWGDEGPWGERRGFDSMVQVAAGIEVAEATAFKSGGADVPAGRPMPCQALDYGAGYLLATGIIAAIARRACDGGTWEVMVSLAGVSRFLRSLGQRPGTTGFEVQDVRTPEAWEDLLEEHDTGFGRLASLKHPAHVEGKTPGWDYMPKPLGSDQPKWL